MATNIPSHNIVELIDAIEYLIKVPDMNEVTISDLMDFIQ